MKTYTHILTAALALMASTALAEHKGDGMPCMHDMGKGMKMKSMNMEDMPCCPKDKKGEDMPCCIKDKMTGEMPCMKDMGMKDMKGMNHSNHSTMHNPAVAELEAANMKMHSNMAVAYTGDADIDFLAGMVPHHQGAVDMAQAVLHYGRDPQVRRLAMEIIRAQNLEIKWMNKYKAQLLAKGVHPVQPNQAPRPGYADSAWAGKTWLNER